MKITQQHAKNVVKRIEGMTNVSSRLVGTIGTKQIFYFAAEFEGKPVKIKMLFDTMTKLSPNGSLYMARTFGQWRFTYFLNLKGDSE